MSGGATERPATLDHLRSLKRPVTRTVPLVCDPEVGAEWDRLTGVLSAAQAKLDASEAADIPAARLRTLRKAVVDAQAEVDAYRPTVEAVTFTFKLRSMGRRSFEELMDAHPPTPAELAEADAKGEPRPQWSADTFAVALIAHTLEAPKLTEAEVRAELWDNEDWNNAELSTLWMAALAVNNERRVADLGNGSGTTRS